MPFWKLDTTSKFDFPMDIKRPHLLMMQFGRWPLVTSFRLLHLPSGYSDLLPPHSALALVRFWSKIDWNFAIFHLLHQFARNVNCFSFLFNWETFLLIFVHYSMAIKFHYYFIFQFFICSWFPCIYFIISCSSRFQLSRSHCSRRWFGMNEAIHRTCMSLSPFSVCCLFWAVLLVTL